jgi:gliding motility-associated-like protein
MAREVIVKSTADSGPSSLREAITNAAAQDTIIIDVKGEIVLNSSISFLSNNITIIGPYAKHNNIRAGSTNMHFFHIDGRAGIKFIGLGFKSSVNARVGIITNSTNVTFESCVFENNTFNGAGILFFDASSFKIENCSFINNSTIEGGAVYVMKTGGTGGKIINSTFAGNSTSGHGGAMYLNSNCFLEIVNNIFKDNSTTGLGEAIQSFDATNVVDFYNNVFELNGDNEQVNGNGSLNDIGGNVIVLNSVGESHPFNIAGSEYNVGTNLDLTNLTEDGYGLKYYRIESASSVLVDNGSPTPSTIAVDCRRVGRALSSLPNISNPVLDSGPFEFTPFTVTAAIGVESFEDIISKVNLSTNFDPILYVDFDILAYTPAIEFDIITQITLSKRTVIDGYSQETTAISGPAINGSSGVTPAQNLINITTSNSLTTGLIVAAQGVTISGLDIYGFGQHGISVFNTASNCHIFGNHIGFSGNGSYVLNENTFTGVILSSSDSKIGGNMHYHRNVITGNGQTGAATFNSNICFTNGVTSSEIIGNFIGVSPSGLSSPAGASGTAYGIFLQGENVQCSDIKIGNKLYGGRNVIAGNKSHGIYLYQVGTGNFIDNNFIGLGYDGTTVLANAQNGIYSVGTVNEVKIGTLKGNVISGNVSNGINLQATSNFVITKNIIGLDSSGLNAKPNLVGISISGTSNSNKIGIDTTNFNVISGNSAHGIWVNNGTDNLIQGNRIGTNKLGAAAIGNQQNGVFCEYASGTIIGGNQLKRNIISGNGASFLHGGIMLRENGSTLVTGNFIGTNLSGLSAIENFNGVVTWDTHDASIGSANPNHNLISGNQDNGIQIASAQTSVEGNVIGLDRALSGALGNSGNGIEINVDNIKIGATETNIISGNSLNGISTQQDGVDIDNCIIGTNPTGEVGLGNQLAGILIENGNDNDIGTIGQNIICGHSTKGGIELLNTTNTYIINNMIGINSANLSVPNQVGIKITGTSSGNTIGNIFNTERNVISGNSNTGILLDGASVTNNHIKGNIIGLTNVLGATIAIANDVGIEIKSGAHDNSIGEDGAVNKANTISGNSSFGLRISGNNTTNNTVYANNFGTTTDYLTSVSNSTAIFIEDCNLVNYIGKDNVASNSPIIGGNVNGVLISNSSNQIVQNCKIGTSPDGLSLQGNDNGIVIQSSSTLNIIGGDGQKRNIISGNSNTGIAINNCTNNKVIGNIIGSDINGNNPISNNIGVFITGGSGNIIGTSNTGEGNLISSNSLIGVNIEGSASTTLVQNNKFGTDLTGNAVYLGSANGVGVQVKNTTVNTNQIGGDRLLNEGNLFADNGVSVFLNNTSGQGVYGNVIGIKADGSSYLGNNNACIGVYMKNGDNNRVGLNNNNSRNNIANQAINIYVDHEVNTDVFGNYIGTNLAGNAILTGAITTGVGIHVDSASLNTRMFENVLSGLSNGIEINGMTTNNNTVQGNKIGTDVTGNNLLGNANNGIRLSGASDINVIGGNVNDVTQRNVISGNGDAGIEIVESHTVIIAGNYIGCNQDGNASIPNGHGIIMNNYENANAVSGIRIGGANLDSMNYFVGPLENGFAIAEDFTDCYVLGNTIGETPSGVSAGMDYAGIAVYSNASNIKIGGVNSLEGNKIVNNGQNGVTVNGTANNVSVLGNVIYNNFMGIDIASDGVTTDNSTGINSNMQMPNILAAFECDPTNTTQVGLGLRNLTIGEDYLIEFYDNSVQPNGLGYGSAHTFLTRMTHTAVANSDTIFVDLGSALMTGTVLSANITSNSGNGSTSEFSQNFAVTDELTISTSPINTHEVCQGSNNSEIELNDSFGGNVYYFALGTDTPEFNPTNDTTWLLPPGTYDYNYGFLNGCTVNRTAVTLDSGPIPTFTSAFEDDTCGLGGKIVMSATGNTVGSLIASPYENITLGTSQASPNFTNLPSGDYDVVLHTQMFGFFNCVSDTLTISISDYSMTNNELDFVFDDFCSSVNGAVTSSPSYPNGVYSLSTNPSGASIDVNTGEISGTVTAGNQYTVDYNYGTCLFQQSPTALNNFDPSFIVSDYCANQTMTPSVTTVGGTFSFVTNPGDGATIDPATGELANITPGNTYSINYNTNGDCPDDLDQDVLVYPSPSAPYIVTSDSLYCNENDIISSLNTVVSSSVNWYNSPDTINVIFTGETFTPVFSNLQIGNNQFYTGYNDVNGCRSLVDSISIYVSSNNGIDVIDDQNVCIDSDLELFASGGDSYIWYNTENKDSLESNVLLTQVQEGLYIVDVILADGCVFTDSVVVSYIYGEECDIVLYSAFSPNSDGVNDYWEIDGIQGFSENKVIIFNRWGDVVTTIENYNNETNYWDGTNLSNGETVVSGTYYYVVEASGTKAYSGWVQVVK